ncbi:hypothetical protein LTR85_007216 [Meristemomyces frigidus]|nr:hypothetical protein LTR85_007216 [Meristemomyces frigidus]
MDKKDENSPSNLWTRRSNSSKLNLSTSKSERNDNHETPSAKRFGSVNSKSNPFNAINPISTSSVASPTGTGASSAFGLGTGAFASFGSAGKTPKTPGSAFDFAKAAGGEKRDTQGSDRDEKESRRPPARKSLSNIRPSTATTEAPLSASKEFSSTQWPLKHAWVVYYRPPTSKNSDYEKSIKPLCRAQTAQEFWQVYAHLKRPSALPTVSDYHFFKDGIRPVWEDEENKRGGKWTMRLKKGVADRYWEDLLLAMIGDQFAEASEEVCGAVVSVRSGEDVFSIWTKNDGGRNVKIRETIKRVLSLPSDTSLQWRSHDESITQRNAVDQARQEKASQMHGDKRRNTLNVDKAESRKREEDVEA